MTQILYGGRALADWVLEGGRSARSPWAHVARLRWHAFWFEHNWRTQAERLDPLPQPRAPVFILGPWRSGTTALHELLAASTGWVTPQTWQCFNPSTCFLLRTSPAATMTPRPMDDGVISSLGPQEDEFAALLLGEASVYRGFIDPRRLRALGACLQAPPGDSDEPAKERQLSRWQLFVRGIAAQDHQRRVLIKSPNHSFRLPWLRRCYPEAQFVWMGRRSRELLASNTKMWRSMMARYALWPCPEGELEGFLADVLRACCSALSQCLEDMAPEQLLWVEFEQLRAAPRQILASVLDFLSVAPGVERDRGLDEALRCIPIHPGSRTLAAADAHTEKLDALMLQMQQRFGLVNVARRRAKS